MSGVLYNNLIFWETMSEESLLLRLNSLLLRDAVMEPKSLCIKLQEFSFLSPFPWGRWVLSAWRLHIWWRQPLPWSLTMGIVMNTFGFCPFHSIENNVLLAQVIRLCVCLSFSSVFLIVDLKRNSCYWCHYQKTFGQVLITMFLIKTVDSSNAIFTGLFLTHLCYICFYVLKNECLIFSS